MKKMIGFGVGTLGSEWESDAKYILTLTVTNDVYDKIVDAIADMDSITKEYALVSKIQVDFSEVPFEAWSTENLSGDTELWENAIGGEKGYVFGMSDVMSGQLDSCELEDILHIVMVINTFGDFQFKGCLNYTYTEFETEWVSFDDFSNAVAEA